MKAFNQKSSKQEGVKYLEYATRYDIVRHLCDTLYDNGWQTSYDYLKYQPKIFSSKPLVTPKGTMRDLVKYIDYCYLLSRNSHQKDEASRYSKNRGLSIYTSVVLYWLLSFWGVVDERKLKYYQGYFRYKTKGDDAGSSPRYRAGMHAWLSYQDSVIDVTIWQQENFFDFKKRGFNLPAILGDLPDGLGLVGFEEYSSLVKDYARGFAKDSGMTFYDWIDYHRQQAELLHEVRIQEPDNNAFSL